MKRIELTQCLWATVDDEDYDRLARLNWYAHRDGRTFYAVRGGLNHRTGKRALIRMHRVIMSAPDGVEVDHVNGDGLDNRKENLRVASSKENKRNQHYKRAGCTSKYRGVHWQKTVGKWCAKIRDGERTKWGKSRQRELGRFAEEEDAARAYDAAARASFGEFAALNFPDQ